MCRKLTNDEFLKKLKDMGIPYIPLDEYDGQNTKINFLCPNNHVFNIRPRAIFDGQGCPYCAGNKVLKGFNDLWTTHPEIAALLKNENDGYMYSYGSRKSTWWICPTCKNEIFEMFKHVSTYGLKCKSCSSGVSYPEKFLMSLLDQLFVDYVYDKSTEWSCNKRYDFYIQDYDMIIETHGIQHYENVNRFFEDVAYQRKNDFFKRELAVKNGIKIYIELDCRHSEKEYIKQSISQSKLNEIFDLSLVDWDKCDSSAYDKCFNDVLKLWNSGIKNSVDISKILQIDRHTSLKHLKNAARYGLCDYDSNTERKLAMKKMQNGNKKTVVCIDTGQIYESVKEAAAAIGCTNQSLSSCCRGERKTCKGLRWRYQDDDT